MSKSVALVNVSATVDPIIKFAKMSYMQTINTKNNREANTVLTSFGRISDTLFLVGIKISRESSILFCV